MKKILSILLVALMAVSSFAFNVSAKDFEVSEGKALALAIDDVTASAGDTVTVKIFVKFAQGHAGISDGAFVLNYDATKLDLIVDDYENPTTLKWLFAGALIPGITVKQDVPGYVEAGFISMGNTAVSGDFFEMQFRVKDGASGKADITFNKGSESTYFNESINYMPTPVDIELVDGSVNIVAPDCTVTFDMDGHGEVVEPVTDKQGETITLPTPAKDGHFNFGGWTTDGTDVLAGGSQYELSQSVTLKAIWIEDDTFDVTFNSDYGTAPETVSGKYAGDTVELVQLTDSEGNWNHIGWTDGTNNYSPMGTYTVKTGQNVLTAIWEEIVEERVAVETFVNFDMATGKYVADVYFYGADANTVSFGYTYGENLTFNGFTPADSFSIPDNSHVIAENGYVVASVVYADGNGVIGGASATAGNGVHLGTISFEFTGTEYDIDSAEDNIALTTPKQAIDYVCSEENFLYIPDSNGLEVVGLPLVFDEIEIEIVNVARVVRGTVKVVRDDSDAPKNFAVLRVLDTQGTEVALVEIEDAETTTENGIFSYAIELDEGEYTFEISKTGYLTSKIEGVVLDGYEAIVDLVSLVAGDVVSGYGEINLLDFAGITSAFDRNDLLDEHILALDINEDGAVTVEDLEFVKINFGAEAE